MKEAVRLVWAAQSVKAVYLVGAHETQLHTVDLSSKDTILASLAAVSEHDLIGVVELAKNDSYAARANFMGQSGELRRANKLGIETLGEAVTAVFMLFAQLVTEEFRLERDLRYRVEQMLKNHDWYYSMSDDSRVYQEGTISYNRLVTALNALDAPVAEELWTKLAPNGFTFPGKKR
jgi:hypothetical protein